MYVRSTVALVGVPAKNAINEAFRGREAWEIVGMTSTTVLATVWLYNFVFQEESVIARGKRLFWKVIRLIPSVRQKIAAELTNVNDSFEEKTRQRTEGVPYITTLPEHGIKPEEILKLVKGCVYLGDYEWQKGRVSGCVYRNVSEELRDLVKEVYGLAALTNPLHPDVFPGICKMEAEVVRIACRLFGGDDETCGTMSSGGTESILLACKAYRDYAREVKGITQPEMVIPVTAHSAFDKAAQYLGIRVRTVPLHPTAYVVHVDAMKRAVTRNTVMMVCSAPNFPYGTMDNVKSIAEFGLSRNIPVHVDACLGGFLLCFMRQAGYQVDDFDFRLPGVTSISADTHKYGFAPKGSSVILYRNKEYRHHQFCISPDWPGGIYGSPTVNGSRAGGIIASCWATLMYFGEDEYVAATRRIIETTKFIEKELRQLDQIYVLGTPATSVIALGSSDFHIYRLSEALNVRGWNLNVLQFPSAVHICVTHVHTEPGVAQQFVDDVREDVARIVATPEASAQGMYALYGMSQTISDRSIVRDITRSYLDSMYYTPKESAAIANSNHHQNSNAKVSQG